MALAEAEASVLDSVWAGEREREREMREKEKEGKRWRRSRTRRRLLVGVVRAVIKVCKTRYGCSTGGHVR